MQCITKRSDIYKHWDKYFMGSSYFANFFSSHDLGKYKGWVKYPGNITYCRGEYHFRSGIFRMTLNQVYLRKTVSLSVSNHLPIWNIPIKFWIVHNPFFNFSFKLQRSIINLLICNPNHLCPYLIEIHKCLRRGPFIWILTGV